MGRARQFTRAVETRARAGIKHFGFRREPTQRHHRGEQQQALHGIRLMFAAPAR